MEASVQRQSCRAHSRVRSSAGRGRSIVLLVLLLLALAGSAALLAVRGPRGTGVAENRLVIVGLDGADWRILDPLIDRGEMPHLEGLIRKGTRARLRSSQPMLSPVLWTTIATGVRAESHGILDFVAVDPESGQVLPVTSVLRKVPALWDYLAADGVTVGVTAWWATFPAEPLDGFMVSDRIAYQLFDVPPDDNPAGKTWPAALHEEIRELIVDPASLDGAVLEPYLGPVTGRVNDPAELEAERQLRAIVASARSYRQIAAHAAEAFRPEVEIFYYQPTDTIAHLVMAYRDPALPNVDSAIARRFGPALDESYRDADRALGEILQRAGPGANVIVCSDHGFKSGEHRPSSADSRIGHGTAARWHRKYGILVMSGPAVAPGSKIREPVTLLDVAPTALAMLGRSVPESMQGRVLEEALSADHLRHHPVRREALVERATARREEAAQEARTAARSADEGAIVAKLLTLGYLSQDSLNARNNRGILYLKRGEPEKAIAEFREALREGAGQVGVMVNLGRAEWLSGDPAAATRTLESALEADASSTAALNLLGNIAMENALLEEAERRFHRALEIEPRFTDALNSLGILEERRGRWDEAIRWYQRVVEVDPDYAEGFNNIGNVYKRRGMAGESESWYRKAIEADPIFAGTYNNLGLLMQERGRPEEAERLYGEALRLAPSEPRTRNNLGSLYFATGRVKEALAEFEEAARLDPEYAEARNSLGVVYGALGRPDDEIAAYREALQLRPDYADARYNLSTALLRRGLREEAAGEIAGTLEYAPRHLPSLLLLSSLRLEQGRPAEAASLARKAIKIAPANATARTALAQALEAAGDSQGAAREWAEAVRLDPSLAAAGEPGVRIER